MLLFFYGKECPHCHEMIPLLDRLEKEAGVSVERYETWHNKEHYERLSKYDTGTCGGVPFMINTETQESICGSTDYEHLKSWALAQSQVVK